MRGLVVATLVVAATLGVSAVRADEAEANRLLVEAVALAEQAARAPREEAVELYRQASEKLDTIVAGHPDSSYAVLIATNQPIGSFRTWEVRHELARLSAPMTSLPACDEPCTWERQFGDGRGNLLQGDPGYMMTDLLARPDGTAVAVANHWHDGEKEVWVAGFGADGARLWERTYPGRPCSAALIDDGFVVLAQDLNADEEDDDVGVLMLLSDGLAPTGFPLAFTPHAIEPDGRGGFLVAGRDGTPVVHRYQTSGDAVWRSEIAVDTVAPGATSGAATAAAAIPGSEDIRVLGVAELPGGDRSVVWTAVLDAAGSVRELAALDEIQPMADPSCDPVMRYWSIDATADGFIVRYDWHDEAPMGVRRTTVVRLDAAGTELWRRVLPINPQDEPDPAAAIAAGLDDVSAVSATADGGALVAGFRTRPAGQGAGYVTRWDADGAPVWSTELRRSPQDESVRDAFFAAVAETADGGVLTTMTDGVIYLRLRGFVFRLGPNGEAP
jgi:hypothetical protein